MQSTGIGALIARLRAERGLSQSRLAEMLAEASGLATVTRHEVARWERGRRVPSVFWLRHLSVALGVDLATLEAVKADPAMVVVSPIDEALRVALEWLVTEPPQVAHVGAGRRIDSGLVGVLSGRVQDLRLLDDHLGGADTLQLVETELRTVANLADEASFSEATGQGLFGVVGELHQLAGWVAADAGAYAKAARYYLDGVKAATAAGDPLSAGNLLSSLAYQQANTGRRSDAVLIAQAAIRGVPVTAGRGRALLLERLAYAHARNSDAADTDRALVAVDEAMGTPGDDEPAWTYWLDQREVDIMAGRCNVELARPLRAVPLLTAAIETYPVDHERETALYETWLAQAYAQANERDAAQTHYRRAADLARGIASARLESRLADVRL